MNVLRLIGEVLLVFLIFQIVARLLRRWFKFPAPAFVGFFLSSPLRRRMQPPATVIARSGITPGMTVLEIGCGSGAFTFAAAEAAGAEGRVYALDIQPGMLAQLARRQQQHPARNPIHIVRASAQQIPLRSSSIDLVFMIATLPEIPDMAAALLETRRVLKPGGTLAVSEFLPDPDYPRRSTTIGLGQRAGFALETTSGNIWNYTVRFVRE